MVCSTAKGLFPLSRNFSMRTHVDFTRANKIEAMYERPQVNVKVEPRSTFTLNLRVAFHTLPLFYLHALILRAFARKNYATLEIKP